MPKHPQVVLQVAITDAEVKVFEYSGVVHQIQRIEYIELLLKWDQYPRITTSLPHLLGHDQGVIH